MLLFLIRNRGRVVSKDDLIAEVWNGRIVSESTLSSRITAVRQAIGDTGEAQHLIRTVPRKGFRFVGEVREKEQSLDAGAAQPGASRDMLMTQVTAQFGDPELMHLTMPLQVPRSASIAVLPLTNLSRDPEQEYFSDGIIEDVISKLSPFSELFVIARNSSFQYKGKAIDVRQVGRELGVRYLLEGSVRRSDDRVRINTRLIECETGGQLWAKRFDRTLTDIFEVQDDIADNVVSALANELTTGARRPRKYEGTDSMECYDTFLRGREQHWLLTSQSNAQAEVLLKRAIELDQKFAPAHAFLADVYLVCFINRWKEKSDQYLRRAYESAERALALDPTYPRALHALASANLWKRHHNEALTAYRKSVELDPNFSRGHMGLGWVLHYAGRSKEAIAPISWGLRLDPHYASICLHWLAQAYFQLSRYEEAAELLKRRLMRTPETDISRVLLASAYGHLGRISEAQAEWREALTFNPDYSLDHRRRILPYKNPRDFDRVVEGLRKAGLPE